MNLNELRAEVRRRQIAAQRKVARLKRKGVDVGGTPFDVRRDPGNISRYNSKQLQSYLGQLNNFTSRTTAFVPGVEGSPIRASKWREYKRAEKAYLGVANAHYEGVKDTFIPAAGRTVQGFDESMRRPRKSGTGGVPRPYEQLSGLSSFEVMDEKKLARLQKRLEQKTSQGYLPKELKKQKFQMLQATSLYGDPELTDMAKKLTNDQFDTLWNYTDAPRDLFAGYHFMQLLSNSKADEAQANIHDDASHETRLWLEWASNLPPRENRKNRR